MVTKADNERLLTDLLKGVSRAFYLTLRVLPRGLREPVGLAYLLARAADTIADTRLVSPDQRLEHLLAFRAVVDGDASLKSLIEIRDSLTEKQDDSIERILLESLPQAFGLLEKLPEFDRQYVQSIVSKLTVGMEYDLTMFPAEDSGEIRAVKDFDELDDYTYHVAGCVGEFWTAISVAHTNVLRNWNVDHMSEMGVMFGKALQLTNVLRDVPKDIRIGRCYLPEDGLSSVGLAPRDLLDAANGATARPVLVEGIRTALAHYEYAERYLLAIPRRCLRLRLAVLWPVLIGLGTLEKLASNRNWLDPGSPSKVPRGWVYRMLAASVICVPSDTILHVWIAGLRKRVDKALLIR